jgi:hypothetical protein
MIPMVRLFVTDPMIHSVEFGGERFSVEASRYVTVPAAAAPLLTRPGDGCTHMLPDPIVHRRSPSAENG